MPYAGNYRTFDTTRIRTYPLATRENKVSIEMLVRPDEILEQDFDCPPPLRSQIVEIARHLVEARRRGCPVILFTGAHLVKNGLGPIVVDMMRHGLVTLVAGNGATSIHDFELALIGKTSEVVPNALPKGLFGMAFEFAYWNAAAREGFEEGLGLGEALGRMIVDEEFRARALATLLLKTRDVSFAYPEMSILANGYRKHIPVTIHVGIGTDVTDQHPSFDGAAKGGTSGRDFLIFAEEVRHMTNGGVILNIGSAVTGPEVLLKSVSMAANVGCPPEGLITADFDLRPAAPHAMRDEASPYYYFRDQKSIVTRIPQSLDGKGYYVEGDQKMTFPVLYQETLRLLNGTSLR